MEPSERPGVTLESLKEHPDFEKLFADVRYEKPNRALYVPIIALPQHLRPEARPVHAVDFPDTILYIRIAVHGAVHRQVPALGRLYERRQQMDNNLNQWILSLNEQQLRTFVDTLYQVITASQADNLIDFTAEWKKSMNGVIAALKEVDESCWSSPKVLLFTTWKYMPDSNIIPTREELGRIFTTLDEETVKALKEIVGSLFEIARENRKKQVAAKAEAALEALGAKGKDGRPKADS